ncbi:hypothetical protein KHC28_14950 [Ancylobacter sonchi]|uniref:hypothetical protein n=1 Tax=Ancylobacter sonchi TaxID=1937790 RepID=UPI001BD4522F|nr:hypothetical protein [Ancylobacter sonchi]MBS7534951.1 hypothetical protein [Ancylobacter sonchi]
MSASVQIGVGAKWIVKDGFVFLSVAKSQVRIPCNSSGLVDFLYSTNCHMDLGLVQQIAQEIRDSRSEFLIEPLSSAHLHLVLTQLADALNARTVTPTLYPSLNL